MPSTQMPANPMPSTPMPATATPQPTPLATTIPTAIRETILTHLSALFLTAASGDPLAARQAAAQMLAGYHPQTEDELRLAATIIGFGLHALEALGQAATPDMPLSKILRLRSSAVSLNRQSEKAHRRLEQIQKARRQAIPTEARAPETHPSAPAQPEPKTIEKALDLIHDTRKIAVAAKASGLTWTQAHEERQREMRIAASLKRAEARIAAYNAQAATPNPQATARAN